jgi:D-beta-D-heptose 7-phosphate kinase/D-beta-D-heptose 1-phosphate adenosyltransferase
MNPGNSKEIVIVASGYFNPIHIGHVRYLREAKKLGTKLIVIINSDKQCKLKGSFLFMNEKERAEIISSLKFVDEVVLSVDKDKTVCKTLELIKPNIFAKGGDRTLDNIPEKEVCEEFGIKMVFNVGGGKVQSSSRLISKCINGKNKQ